MTPLIAATIVDPGYAWSMNLLITGAAGFIGSHFLERAITEMANKVENIVVVDLLTYSGLQSTIRDLKKIGKFTFVQGDISDFHLVENIFERYEISDCINFAAESHVDRSINFGEPFIHTNIVGSFNLIENFRKYSRGRFLQVSTDEVYGSISQGSWNESEPLKPNSPYAASKASADLLILSFFKTYGLDVVVSRCSNNYGPRQFPEKFIPRAICNVLMDEKIPIYGQGTNVRDWIHVRDHCRALEQIFEKGRAGEVYNVGGNNEVRNIDLARQILLIMGQVDERISFVDDRLGHDFRYSVDSSKIRKEIGFKCEVDFEAGLVETVKWYQENVAWWSHLVKMK